MLSRRFEELARTAFYKGVTVYTDFLDLNQQSIFHQKQSSLPRVPISMFGGCEDAERIRICFHGEAVGAEDTFELNDEIKASYPIQCLKISPANQKFAENLTHRDYLGAILNLGIDRSKTGDILLNSEGVFLYCDEQISDYLKDNLNRVKHTTVRVNEHSADEEISREFEVIKASVASIRLDAVIGAAFHESRSFMSGLIPGGKVFVNGKEILQPSHILKPNDVVSVRGYGKFRYKEQGNLTKKGRVYITIEKYI